MSTRLSQQYIHDHHRLLFESTVDRILSSAQRDVWQDELGFPLPDIVFGDNRLKLAVYNPTLNEWTSVLEWSCKHALSGILHCSPFFVSSILNKEELFFDKLPKSAEVVELSYAKDWRSTRNTEHMTKVSPSYDWTFFSFYQGNVLSNHHHHTMVPISQDTFSDEFDKDLLLRRDSILFSDSFTFYEDEMSDSGTSICSIKIRVMPSCFLILFRSYVKINQVLLRALEVRHMGQTKDNPNRHHDHQYICYKEVTIKELKWTSDSKVFATFNLDKREDWQKLQSNEEEICRRLPVIYQQHYRLTFYTY